MGEVLPPAPYRPGLHNEANGLDMSAAFGYHYTEAFDSELGREPILDPQDTQFVADFFDNPNDPKVAAILSRRADSNVNPSMDDHHDFGVNFTFDQSASGGTINPVSTMAGPSHASYGTHANTLPMRAQPGNFQTFGSHMHQPATENNHEVIDSASSLMNMAAAQDGAYTIANSWDSMSGLQYSAHGLMPATGGPRGSSRQSNSAPSYLPAQVQADFFLHSQHLGEIQRRTPQTHQSPYGLQHMRTHSLNSDVSQLALHAQSMPQSMSPANHQQTRMPLARYNSDPHITNVPFGYNIAPSAAEYQAKEDTLMQLPFATQAQSGHVRSHAPHAHQPSQRGQQFNRVPHGYHGFTSTQSSPIDSLPPTTAMSTPTQHHLAQWGALRLSDPRYAQEEDMEAAPAQSHPRKRRKSRADRDDDLDYQPGRHAQNMGSKRGSKVPKAEPASDDEEAEPFTPADRSTAKRRKSTITQTASGSSPHSPARTASPSNGASSSARRKSSAKSRQNLSDEQKRQNHIISEQKRRNVIKQGYLDLDNLVPILNGGKSGLSKAEQVKEIVAFLESLVSGNQLMEAKLRSGALANEYGNYGAGGGDLAPL
ncbi:hypothetical protein B0A54_09834 [Friedmanniomyces endolithicus]|uniref:BHLH domain-containing protein n=1 Tax=Friedmanniomyces endolithicus TaxID=329885 RepID=A0A4U0UPI1_9PEZI|nr:hypothetical protein LTS09_008035 [Friedmanniomyces endolithicus]TKA37831.1 hypothetical protein B0A54_09834 [Friedmanniomyces endolithicus]